MADWSTPQLSSTYKVFRQALNDRLVDAALMFDSTSTSATNIPSGAKRWNSTSSKFEKYNGSTWSDLAPLYAISISGNAATATTAGIANGLSAGVALANLADKAITYAKMQDVSAQYRLLGRRSVGAGTTEEVTATQLFDWYGTTRGSLICRGLSSWAMLPPGTSGQVLMSGGAGADLYWGTISFSGYATTAYVASYFDSAIAPYATTSYVNTKVNAYKRIAAGYGGVGTPYLKLTTTTASNPYSAGGLYAISGLSGGWRCCGSFNTGGNSINGYIYHTIFEREY